MDKDKFNEIELFLMRKWVVLLGYIFYCRFMLFDVIDEFMIFIGERKDVIFYFFYVFFNKLVVGLGLGIL